MSIPPPFLKQVATHYKDELLLHNRHLEDRDAVRYRFIFPSKRAILFFRHYLAEVMDEPIFAPKCETINDFILGLAPQSKVLDQTALLFQLYQCYQEVRGVEAEPFEDFIFWGSIILKDFDLIDRHLLAAKALYTNLTDYKELQDDFSYMSEETRLIIEQFWAGFKATKGDESSEIEGNFLEFWRSLLPLYEAFIQQLTEDDTAYEGMVYKRVAQNAIDIADTLAEREKIVFVGLFDISPSELKLFRALRQRGCAEFCWDEQVHILTDEHHPATRVLRANKEALGFVRGSWHYASDRRHLPSSVEVISCSSTVAQVKAMPEILADLHVNEDSDDLSTAIVLPSEQLLLPTVGSIPPHFKHINVTLGYPLNRTPVAVMINRWIKLLLSAGGKDRYRADRLLALLSLKLLTERHTWLVDLSESLRRQRNYYLSAEWIIEKAQSILSGYDSWSERDRDEALRTLRLLLNVADPERPNSPEQPATTLLEHLAEILNGILTRSSIEGGEIEDERLPLLSIFDAEFIHHYLKLVYRLAGLIDQYGLGSTAIEATVGLLESITQGFTIPFEGDPLRGLQIMGMLESRALHFSTLIYLSAQEGHIPKNKSISTLIPYTLRRGHGLPTTDLIEAAEAYRFFQSIAKCDRLTMIYGQEDATGGQGEESRYIRQMEYLYDVPIIRRSAQAPPSVVPADSIIIDKRREDITKALARYTATNESERKELSASRLNTYIKCPLRFYYEAIEEVREEQPQSELMASNEFGTVLHESMQTLYAPYVGGKAIDRNDVAKWLEWGNKMIDRVVLERYLRLYNQKEPSALDKLYCDMIGTYVRALLKFDLSHEENITYLGSEVKVRGRISLADGREVFFKGDIDRLDIASDDKGKSLRVLDYKTGGDKIPEWNVEKTEAVIRDTNKKAVLQTLLYCELVAQSREQGGLPLLAPYASLPIKPGVLLVKQISQEPESFDPYVRIKGDKNSSGTLCDYEEVREKYLMHLKELLGELFDLSRPFVQTSDPMHCTHCPFRLSCGK